MHPQRILPPAATPIYLRDIARGLAAIASPHRAVGRFESGLKTYFNVRHCFLVSSGKAALYCILKALQKRHPDRNEVLIPAYNCYSVPSAIVRAGCTVRLCDVSPRTLDFDADALATALADPSRLLCVVPAHLFGLHADVNAVRRRCAATDPSIVVVEDAAQAMGSEDGNVRLGCLGDVGFFSLGRGKVFSTYEGGIIVTNNDEIGNNLKAVVDGLPEYSLRQIAGLVAKSIAVSALSHPRVFWLPKALPALKLGDTFFDHDFTICKLSPYQAGLAWDWARKLRRILARRRENTAFYAAYFQKDRSPEVLPYVKHPADAAVDLLRFPVLISNETARAEVMEKSGRHGLGIAGTFPKSLDEIDELQGRVTGDFPGARTLSRNVVTLPVHYFVTGKDLRKIVDVLAGAVRDATRGTTSRSP